MSPWIRQRLSRKGKLIQLIYINTNYSFCKSKWHPSILTKKPVSPFVIPTSSDLSLSGDIGVRDQLKGTWAGETELKERTDASTVMGV